MSTQERKGKAQGSIKKTVLPAHVKETQRQLHAMKLIIGNLLSSYTQNIKFVRTPKSRKKRK